MSDELSSELRLLHLPNERAATTRQVGAREAFQALLSKGELSALETFSYRREEQALGSSRAACHKLYELAKHFRPSLIFWQHVADFDVTPGFVRALKRLPSKPRLVYHEADPYGSIYKRLTKPMKVLMAEADLVFMVGLGRFTAVARKAGARRVLYAPHNVDTVRFGTPWDPTPRRQYDAVMIGTATTTRIPGLPFPGAKRRRQLARSLCQRLGPRFALYGGGWDDLPCSKGFCDFEKQEQVIRSAWLSINWDQFDDVPYYFSNRLPISLAAGVPHVTTYHPGYEHLFRDCEGLFAARTVSDALEIADWLLSLPRERLIELGQQGMRFALERLESTKVYAEVIEKCRQELFE